MSLGGGGGGGQAQQLAQEIEQIEQEQQAIENEIENLRDEQTEIDEAIEAIKRSTAATRCRSRSAVTPTSRAEIADIDEVIVSLGGGYAAEREEGGRYLQPRDEEGHHRRAHRGTAGPGLRTRLGSRTKPNSRPSRCNSSRCSR